MKTVAGLGNPGAEYARTRHNAGWWFADHLAEAWGFGSFRREKYAAVAAGRVGNHPVRVVKPLTFMNLSGQALAPLRRTAGVDLIRDVLVVVDDVALPAGRVRFRASGSAGGHNGLRSIEQTFGTRDYARLRIGVGEKPPGWDLARWVLGRMPRDEEAQVRERFPELVEGVEVWMDEGVDAAMNRCNR
ncbi:aminoacyl-tRNA hydrolase [soil metagenome]